MSARVGKNGSATLSLAAASLFVLTACTTDQTTLTQSGLTRTDLASAKPLSALDGSEGTASVAADRPTAGVQAYQGGSVSEVEASTEALAAGVSPAKAAGQKPAFDLFKAIQENNRRAGKRSVAKPAARARASRTAKARVQSPTRRSVQVSTPKVVTKRREKLAALPGVRREGMLAEMTSLTRTVGRKAGSTVRKAGRTLSKPVRVASAAALGRVGRHGLRTQHSKVSVGCLKPSLVKLIKRAERHFGRHAVVTSGYRSPRHNRRIGGARKSLHVSCQAADIQINGVTKWQLASWMRKQPGRGGVGTYCHTRSVHIDTGKARDWNWRCKRRKRRRS